jgi:hypothetical protein
MPRAGAAVSPGLYADGSPRFGLESVCTNCHVTIHGSNLDELFLK